MSLNSVILVVGFIIAFVALVATVAVGIKPKDKSYSMAVSFRNLIIIYVIIFIVSGIMTYWVLTI